MDWVMNGHYSVVRACVSSIRKEWMSMDGSADDSLA